VDYDNDGRLDVYATNRNGPNSLYRNAGDSFTRVSGGPDDPGPTVGSCWFDMDRDGDLDVFLANQSGAATPCGATTARRSRTWPPLSE
jgi:hypothetical protein